MINDGGPAFPSQGRNYRGMTVRDYFAGEELAKTAGPCMCDDPAVYERLADHCYRMADAMIAARELK
jgi:hypothetical protein